MSQKSLKSCLKEKKGFTLIEMMVTCIILALVTAMISQVTYSFYRSYQVTEARWKVQNETKVVMQQLENSQTGVKSSASADLFYYADVASGIPGLAGITPADVEKGYYLAKVTKSQAKYTYFFTLPAPAGEKGVYVWKGQVIPTADSETTTTPSTTPPPGTPETPNSSFAFKKISSIPMDIQFTIPSRPTVRREEPVGSGNYVTEPDNDLNDIYLTRCVHVVIKGSGDYGNTYSLEETLSLENLFQNQDVNITAGEPTDKALVAGWTNTVANADPVLYMKTPIKFSECPNAAKPANVARYIAVGEYYSSGDGGNNIGDMNVGNTVGICGTKVSMAGSTMENFVLGSMRDFRDNVLSKSDIGTKVIDYYYNSWSPKWVKAMAENSNMAKLYKAIIVPVAAVASIFS
ncbi:MAG: prepilin-type N-terminal cleavage/methylation domain-containing protein [Oscillospiraceae bacterium]